MVTERRRQVKRAAGHTRDAILAAAATEFAAHGFAGASVDDIAARSGFNKAMIYYHFKGKRTLYVEILRDVFRQMGARTTDIAASDLQPGAKIEAFIDALDQMAENRPYMPPIMMREMAEGARRLDADTLRLMAVIFRNVARILDHGARTGAFRPADPTLTYFSLIGPVIFFRATAPIRQAFGRTRILKIRADSAAFVANLKRTARAALAPDTPAAAGGRHRAGAEAPAYVQTASPGKTRRRPGSTRSGDHA
jgi:TetR/AcrR family transcriptional regulator